jgi:hypothetical protein
MALAVVQSALGTYGAHGNGGTDITNVIMGTAPTNGNLLVCIMDYNRSNANPPVANTHWTLDTSSSGDSVQGVDVAILYKYASSGESTTQIPVSTGESTGACMIWEISGVSGTWSTDRVKSTAVGPQSVANSTAFTDGGISTTNNNELVLTAIFGDNGIGYATPAALSQIGSGTLVADQHQGATGGPSGTSAAGGHYVLVAASGTNLQGHTSTTNSSYWEYGYVELQSAAAFNTETANVTLALSKVSFSAAGGDEYGNATLALNKVSFAATEALEETAATTLALRGVSFAAASAPVVSVSVTLALNGVAIAAYASDLEAVTKLRQFHTFG